MKYEHFVHFKDVRQYVGQMGGHCPPEGIYYEEDIF
jgi:hypothetical protein